ncbi:MAG: hypothetical protein HZC37_23450 [Burkholderiales bacterium]|nr:hypothetical protein [Burkholderiales bacterium]
MTVQHVLAALGFLACVALLVHHGLGARRQARLHLWWRARAASLRFAWSRLHQTWRRRGEARQVRGRAEREAADLIERARRGAGHGEDGGKVIRPRRFGDQRKDLH